MKKITNVNNKISQMSLIKHLKKRQPSLIGYNGEENQCTNYFTSQANPYV